MTISEAFELRIISLMGEGKQERTLKNYRSARNSLLRAVGEIPIELISHRQIAVWNYYLKQNGASDTYVIKNYSQLKSVLKYLIENDMKVMEPQRIKSPKPDTAPKVPLTGGEIQRLIDACSTPRNKAIVALMFTTGARPFEILDLEKNMILEAPFDDKGRQKVSIRGKGGKYRDLFISTTARRYIDAYLETRRNPVTGKLDYYKPLFMSQQNRQIGLDMVTKIIHKAAADAGLEKHVTSYVLRHSFATILIENDAPIELVSKTMGHSNVAITSRVYSHARTEVRQDMVDQYLTPIN